MIHERLTSSSYEHKLTCTLSPAQGHNHTRECVTSDKSQNYWYNFISQQLSTMYRQDITFMEKWIMHTFPFVCSGSQLKENSSHKQVHLLSHMQGSNLNLAPSSEVGRNFWWLALIHQVSNNVLQALLVRHTYIICSFYVSEALQINIQIC